MSTVEGFTGLTGWGGEVLQAGTAYAGWGGPRQEATEPHSEGQAPPAPRQWHLLCFVPGSSSHVHGFLIAPSEPPAERQAHAHFVFKVFGGPGWLRNLAGLVQRVSSTVSILPLLTLTLAHSLTLLFSVLPFKKELFCIESESVSHSVTSTSLQPHAL